MGQTTTPHPLGLLAAINVYPVKSLKGTALDQGVVTATGLAYDRRWLIVDEEGGFLSQREVPRMCLITPTVGATSLRLGAPGMSDIELPLRERGGERRRVTVWDDEVEAEPAPAYIGEWLSDFLGGRYQLVRMPEETVRGVDPQYARAGDRVGFADAFPFLIIAQASLDDLNRRLVARGEQPLPMDRFRPNLVVAGCQPFAEDEWRNVSIGDIGFRVVKPCARCVITTTDQATGATGREPLRTLASYRRKGTKVLFGQNACHDSEGELRVGDAVSLVPAAGELLD
ncbi:MAG TPA: MOSC N-terminal beta barrel domain-containing protein [Trueperaceae bacterium]|nr:MOSC N-terminal beta barrel domain-containing protein [Trueperaceae bacterium]